MNHDRCTFHVTPWPGPPKAHLSSEALWALSYLAQNAEPQRKKEAPLKSWLEAPSLRWISVWLQHPEGAQEACGLLCFESVADAFHLEKLMVDPKHQRQGYASRLMHQCFALLLEEGASKACAVWLEVSSQNLPAYNLYKRFGFHQKGFRRDYYGPSDHAIVMAQSLGALHSST